MNFKKIGRILVCLVLVCALLIHISPVKARADAVSGTLAISSVAGVTISAPMVVAAALIVLGIGYAASNEDFQWAVSKGVEAIGNYVEDGYVELIQAVDALGKSTFYIGGDVLEALRSWLFGSEVVTVDGFVANPNVNVSADALAQAYAAPYAFFSYTETVSGAYAGYMSYVLCYSYESPIVAVVSDSSGNGFTIKCKDNSASGYLYNSAANYWGAFTGTAYGQNTSVRLVDSCYLGTADPLSISTTYDLQLGVLPTVPIDGTSARTWAPEYANRGLYVVPGSGTGGNEGQDGKWFWPLFFGLSSSILAAMSQAEAWVTETPDEFSEYEEKQEYEVTPAPEFEGYPSIEITPVTAPDVDPGDGSDATEPEDPDSGGGEGTDYTSWFERLIKGIEELPSKFAAWFSALVTFAQQFPDLFREWMAAVPGLFETWIADIRTFAQEFPSLFEEWVNNIIGAIQEYPAQMEQWLNALPDKFAGFFENVQLGFASVADAIVDLGNFILSGLRTVLTEVLNFLFVPEEGFVEEKVQSLSDEFSFAASIITTGKALTNGLSGITTSPPIIYIDLGASTGSHNWGGKTVFMDLSWYAEYKPTVDILISAFLWICFIWRLILKLPGIISGMPGDFAMGAAHLFGLDNHLPTRNAAYEVQRAENRNYIKRGPPK